MLKIRLHLHFYSLFLSESRNPSNTMIWSGRLRCRCGADAELLLLVMTAAGIPSPLPVQCIEDLYNDKHRQCHRFWFRIIEDVTVNSLESFVLDKALHVVRLPIPSKSIAPRNLNHHE